MEARYVKLLPHPVKWAVCHIPMFIWATLRIIGISFLGGLTLFFAWFFWISGPHQFWDPMILGEFKKNDFCWNQFAAKSSTLFAKTLRDQLTLCDGYSPPNPTRSRSPCSLLMPLNLVHEVCRSASILAKMHLWTHALRRTPCSQWSRPRETMGTTGGEICLHRLSDQSRISVSCWRRDHDHWRRNSNAVATDHAAIYEYQQEVGNRVALFPGGLAFGGYL